MYQGSRSFSDLSKVTQNETGVDLRWAIHDQWSSACSHLKSNDEALTSKLTEVVFHTVVAMLRAGVGSTHCEMIKELFPFQRTGINTETHAQVNFFFNT